MEEVDFHAQGVAHCKDHASLVTLRFGTCIIDYRPCKYKCLIKKNDHIPNLEPNIRTLQSLHRSFNFYSYTEQVDGL